MRNAGFQTWLALRVARFAMWAWFLVYTFLVLWDKASYVDHFGRPFRSTEAWLFGIPGALVIGAMISFEGDGSGRRPPNDQRLWFLCCQFLVTA